MQAQSPANSHNPTPATALLPPGEGSNSPLATVHLSSEGDSFLNSQANNNITNNNIANITINSVNSQTNSQGLSPIHTPAIAHLPLREGSNPLPGAVHLPPEGDSSPQSTSSTPAREENNSSQAIPPPVTSNPQSSSSPQSGQGNNPPGQVGKALGTPRQQPIQPSQEACATSREGNPTSTPPSRSNQGSSNEEPNPKWVINLSNKPLTPAQRSVLAKGPNFAVTPRQPPNLEYITAIEAACTKLSQQDAEELRADVNRVLRSSHPPQTQSNQGTKHSSKGT